MIKLSYVMRRLPGMTMCEFQSYWRNTHGPLMAKHATTLGCRKYVQIHTLEDPLNAAFAGARGLLPAYDGVDLLWWNNREELERALSTPEGKKAAEELLEDERKFIDFSKSSMYFGWELPQINPTPETLVATEKSPYIFLITFFRHLPAMTLEEGEKHWYMNHGPMVRTYAHAARMLRYIQIHKLPDDPLIAQMREARGGMDEPFHGHSELIWDRQQMMESMCSSEGMKAYDAFYQDEVTFIDHSRCAFWVAKEHILIDR